MTTNKEHIKQVYLERKKQLEIDSYKRIINEKDARIRELEQEIKLLMKLFKEDNDRQKNK